jgi:hypothetical protein
LISAEESDGYSAGTPADELPEQEPPAEESMPEPVDVQSLLEDPRYFHMSSQKDLYMLTFNKLLLNLYLLKTKHNLPQCG